MLTNHKEIQAEVFSFGTIVDGGAEFSKKQFKFGLAEVDALFKSNIDETLKLSLMLLWSSILKSFEDES